MSDSKSEYRLDPPSHPVDQKPPVYAQQSQPQQSTSQQWQPQQQYPQQQGYFVQQPFHPQTFSPQQAYPQQQVPVSPQAAGIQPQFTGTPGRQPAFLPNVPQQASPMHIGDAYRANLFAQCAQGLHSPKTEYGVGGIITAILCFPIGLVALFIDQKRKCERCGVVLP